MNSGSVIFYLGKELAGASVLVSAVVELPFEQGLVQGLFLPDPSGTHRQRGIWCSSSSEWRQHLL